MSALLGAFAIGLGAFGAHYLKAQLTASGKMDIWDTAVLYHLVHAVALLTIAIHLPHRKAVSWLWTLGVIFFSGSLYTLALHPTWKWIGPITPLGGALLIAGWIGLLWKPRPSALPSHE